MNAAAPAAPDADAVAMAPAAPSVPAGQGNEKAAVEFAPKAAANDLFEIEAAKIAQARASNPEVKAYAQIMGETHATSSSALSATVANSGEAIQIPQTLPDDLQNKLDDLNKVDAKDFDKTYIDTQVDTHQKTLDLLSRYANEGDVPILKTYAGIQISTVQAHLNSAKQLKEKLG